MATKSWSSDFLDAVFTALAASANRICLCSAEPTTYTQATDTYRLAHADLSSADFGAVVNGTTSGRQMTVAQKTGVTVAATGVAAYVALVDTTNLRLKYVGRASDYGVTLGEEITIAETQIEISDPY